MVQDVRKNKDNQARDKMRRKGKGAYAAWVIAILLCLLLCACGANQVRGDAELEQLPSEVTTEIEEQEEPQQALQESEQPAEEVSSEPEVFDTSETEIRGGTNQADAMQLPMNTKVYGTLQDGQNWCSVKFSDNDFVNNSCIA